MNNIEDLNISKIIYIVKRSKIRMKILEYLNKIYPNYANLSTIAKKINVYPHQVKGIIVGGYTGYPREKSLINLGLVEIIKIEKTKFYRITSLGRFIVSNLGEIYGEAYK